MQLTRSGLRDAAAWEKAGVKLPKFDTLEMARRTRECPVWVHFGVGNIFRGYIAELQQQLLEQGFQDAGIVGVVSGGPDVLEQVYRAHDNLTVLCSIRQDGEIERGVIGAIGEVVSMEDLAALARVFAQDGLQLASFTITEKGYRLSPDVELGPGGAQSAMAVACAGLLARYEAGGAPIALVSMDNCSKNGDVLRASIVGVAKAWRARGSVEDGFVRYVGDENRVSFPWSMIDKITPSPAESVCERLRQSGIEGMEPLVTQRGSRVAPFVNAEIPGYLVIEDRFPNGRPPLERAGVYMTGRDTVEKAERMKVTACLNPLHTALAVYGCLLGYTLIADEMRDPELSRLAKQIGREGIRAVQDPGIIDPARFLEEVLQERLPNPFMPDTPQRIACDSSQKVPIRYGETIKRYVERPDLDIHSLVGVPLALAGWLRYLLGVDDALKPFEPSADPLLAELQAALSGITVGRPETLEGQLAGLLSNEALFGVDLAQAGLAGAVEKGFRDMIQGAGAVRRTLQKRLG